ncbi:hypothetical protein KJ996_06510, partial [Patescibacteria group bacterium]|nr:hypothetical protein [Patescibacteria group bacterium]
LQGWEIGQLAAILNKVSSGDREKLEALLRDEVDVRLVERILKLFDKNGRRIPSRELQTDVCDANRKFYLIQPNLKNVSDYDGRLVRFQQSFGDNTVTATPDFLRYFVWKSGKLISEIKNDKNLANLLNGVYLPIILPKLQTFSDYGDMLEKVFLLPVKFSYERQFPDRKFYNHRENKLSGKISIVSGVKHEQLIEKMKREYVFAIYFPNSLQGFSVLASREQIATLPDSLILSGGFDTAAAMAMYPDILARDWHTPGYNLSALIWQSLDYSLSFRASDDRLFFNYGGDLGSAYDGYSSSLLFLGSA